MQRGQLVSCCASVLINKIRRSLVRAQVKEPPKKASPCAVFLSNVAHSYTYLKALDI